MQISVAKKCREVIPFPHIWALSPCEEVPELAINLGLQLRQTSFIPRQSCWNLYLLIPLTSVCSNNSEWLQPVSDVHGTAVCEEIQLQ